MDKRQVTTNKKIKDCRFCMHLKQNKNFNYQDDNSGPVCYCGIESEFWEGDIEAIIGGPIECEDYKGDKSYF